MSKLSQCPFCGEEPTFKTIDIHVTRPYPYVHTRVWCEYCSVGKDAVVEVDLRKRPSDFVEALIKAESVATRNWNKRGENV